jgi:2-oxoglutarate ferredoxin oxidoreductase subunit beta
MASARDYMGSVRPTWCTGCGNFGIWNALRMALAELEIPPHEVMIVSGIGCGSKLPDYTHANGYMSLHGRTIPVATGYRMANHGVPVICTHGDGDGLAEGLGHMMHAVRRNVGLVDIIQDNRIYGLTKGQYAPTSPRGKVSKTSPWGSIEQRVNPLSMALVAGATFVSRSWSGDIIHLRDTIIQAIQHKGYALVDVLQPCVSFNRGEAYEFYRPLVYKLEEEPDYDPTDRMAAYQKALEWEERIPIGVLYQLEDRPPYEEMHPALRAGALVRQPFHEWTEEEIEKLIVEYS